MSGGQDVTSANVPSDWRFALARITNYNVLRIIIRLDYACVVTRDESADSRCVTYDMRLLSLRLFVLSLVFTSLLILSPSRRRRAGINCSRIQGGPSDTTVLGRWHSISESRRSSSLSLSCSLIALRFFDQRLRLWSP